MQPTYYEFILAKYEDVFGCKKENKSVKGYQKITVTNSKAYRRGGLSRLLSIKYAIKDWMLKVNLDC